MSIEIGIFIAVMASFGLGIYLGQRSKPGLKAEINKLKRRLEATEQELDKALDAIRDYRRSDEEYDKSTRTLAEQIATRDKLLARIKESLAGHRMEYDDIMGWLKPIQGEEYTFTIEVTRKSTEDLERMYQARNKHHNRSPQPKQAVQATTARQYSSPVIPAHHRADHYRHDDSNDTVSMVTQAAVLCSVMDTTHERQPTTEPDRCYSPSTDSFDTGSCNVSMD